MTRICLCPRGPMGACASSGCGTRRGDCGAVCPGMLMQCPGAHTQVSASPPHFLKTAPSLAGICGAAGRAAGRRLLPGPPLHSLGGTARTPGPTGPRRAGGRLRALPWASPPPQLRALGPVLLFLTHGAVKQARGAEAPPGCGGPDRVRVGGGGSGCGPPPARLSAAPPAGPRQQRTPQAARPPSTDKRLLLPLLSFPPALTGEGLVLASREAGGPSEKLGEGASPEQDALASVSLGPCHLPGRSRVPAARRVLCPEPSLRGAFVRSARQDYAS